MAKLTKFKAQQVEFPTHYKVEDTNRGDTKIKNIIPAFGTIRENGTPETEEIYNGLQLGNVHTLQANKTTNLNIDYYVCNLDGLTEFGLNNDLKLRINVDTKNTNSTTKLRLNNIDYTLLKEYNGTLKQIEAGDFKPNKTYEMAYNGNQFVIINITEYGTESDTALEGKRLAEIIGLEYGGNIQDTSTKTTGKFYYDKALKYYYECIVNNSLTYNDGSKFRAISNKPISDRLENLFKIEILSMTNLLGYIAGTDTTEWYVNLPSHIKKDKVISVTNINQASWFEYCNLDIDSNCIRVGSKGNASNVPVKNIKVLVAYFT
jgi:hypothetical protein|nr:MAG TPA: hypothetical protein [Caudoviricetes sp.]